MVACERNERCRSPLTEMGGAIEIRTRGTGDETETEWDSFVNRFNGTGTEWDAETETCISVIELNPCVTDLDFDGNTAVSDLILLLSQFGVICAL